MRPEYVKTLDGDIIKYPKFYIDVKNFKPAIRPEIDIWCVKAFGAYRHDNEVDEGWWLQTEDEYILFILTWGDYVHG